MSVQTGGKVRQRGKNVCPRAANSSSPFSPLPPNDFPNLLLRYFWVIGTDAFDTLYIGCEKFPQHDFYGGFVGEVK